MNQSTPIKRGILKRMVMIIVFSLPTFIHAQTFYTDLEATATNHHLVGMSVAVVCQNAVLDSYNYGLADIARNIPITDSTFYRIASISKSVTATALMILYEQGLFGLDDDVSNQLGFELRHPSYPNVAITYRMLLSHTSSIIDGSGYSYFLSATYGNPNPPTIQTLLLPGGTYYTANTWIGRSPGTYFNYSNVNFGIIGTLIERLSGQRFDLFVREHVLVPLQIAGSFNVNDLLNINNVAVLYRNAQPQADNYQGITPTPIDLSAYVIGTNGFIFSPQGGLRITAGDLCKFMMMHASYGVSPYGTVLDSSTIALMHSPQWTYNGTNGNNYSNLFNQWGLGLQLTTNTPMGDIVIDGLPMTGHAGEAYGLISDMYFEHDKLFGIVFITNGYYSGGGYQYGSYSAFYKPEEEVFTSIKNHPYSACIYLNAPEFSITQRDKLLQLQENTLVLDQGFSPDALMLSDITGRMVAQYERPTNKINLPSIKPGIYLWKALTKYGAQQGKLFINKAMH
jgi:CubicO group peptidase (beta-lactamase class C family)